MMQEQWEKEGKSGSTYDRELNPVAVFPDSANERHVYPPPALAPAAELTPKNAQGGTWPFKAQTPELERTHTPIAEPHAGYSTIPKVQSTPVLGGQSPKPEAMDRFEVEDEEAAQKQGRGCCCVVM